MKGHLGAVLTTGLAAGALALTLLQAAIVAHGAPKAEATAARSTGQSNRYSAPGGRSAIPWSPSDKQQDKAAPLPESPEGRTPPRQQQQEHRTPPPSRFRGSPPRPGPQPARRAAA